MQIRVSITKQMQFQGRTEDFSNIYNFVGVADDDAAINAVVDAVVAAEKLIFGTNVLFFHARAWEINRLAENYMRVSKPLSGYGSAQSSSSMYGECAIMVTWPLPSRRALTTHEVNPNRVIQRKLRKYLHTMSLHGYDTSGTSSAVSTSLPSTMTGWANAVRNPVSGVDLCAPNGDLPTGGPVRAPYLEHRQFPQGRKRKT